MKIYTYKNCDSCRKATKWFREKGIEFEEIPIRDSPPPLEELEKMLSYLDGELRRLFNTSGRDYRSLNLIEKLPSMEKAEAFNLLSEMEIW